MQYQIEKEALKLLKKGFATNLKVGCRNEFGRNCGSSAVYDNLKEVEEALIYLNNFVGSDANGFYVMIDED